MNALFLRIQLLWHVHFYSLPVRNAPSLLGAGTNTDTANMSATRLDTLTNELFENTVECLDLQDFRNLHMVSKAVAYKATQNHFASYFSRKRADLTRPVLQEFVQATSQGARLGCRVRHLTLTGVEYCIPELEKVLNSAQVITDTRLGSHDSHHGPKRRVYTTEELNGLQTSLDKLRQSEADDEDFHGQRSGRISAV